MKAFGLLLFFFTNIITLQAQEVLSITGKGKLIADFSSTGESPNVKGLYLEKYQTLVSVIEGTNTVKCMVRIGGTVNVIGVWELNDLNDVKLKIYEVEMESGKTDVLMVGLTDDKAIQINLFRLNGEDLDDLGYNYLEQKNPGEPMEINIGSNVVTIHYDKGTENPQYGIRNGVFTEIINE